MRVAIVVKSLQIGGMEKVAVSLAEAFLASGHESHLIYFKDKNRSFSPNKAVNVHLLNIDKKLQKSIVGILWIVIARLLNTIFRKSYFFWRGLITSRIFSNELLRLETQFGKFDLVIIRGQSSFEETWAFHDPRIVQVCESNVYNDGGWLHKKYMYLLYANKNIACVSSVVETSYIQMQKAYSIDNPCVATLTNPIDETETKRLADVYTPDIKNSYIVCVGRLVPVKNIPLLVEAYAYAKKRLGLKHDLVIVGDGSEKEKIKRLLVSLGLENSVTMTGMLTNPYPWMKHADLFVLSSISEGLGMVLLEAIACGTKVVSTDCDGVRDVMKGELKQNLALQEVEDLAKKVMDSLNDGSINYEKYLDDYRPKKIVQNYLNTYRS